jgi:PIN domain nuclease of toxin-antitoxin system
MGMTQRLLLDTHALLWWFAGNERLPQNLRDLIDAETTDVFVSAVSAWEITTKYRLGKLPIAGPVAADVSGMVDDEGFTPLPLTLRHAQVAGALPGHHRDPFDRMLVAQAMIENLTLASNEALLDAYGVRRVW